MSVISFVKERFLQLGDRSRASIVNIAFSFGAKGITILTQMLIVPLTINYVNPTRYGIWLTLSQTIGWIGFFNLGFGNGMRNKVAEAKAKGNIGLARQYVSTTYFAISAIVICLFVFSQIINLFISWPRILHVDLTYAEELRKVASILITFLCMTMVVNLFDSLLTADQKPAVASWIGAIGQILSLAIIYILTKVSNGSLLNLALFYSGVPALVLLIVSAFAFRHTSYKQYSPSIKHIRKGLIKDILGIGIQFFIIYLCLLVIFQVINLIIARELGPEAVTEYNIAYKYFNIAYSVMIILLSPFWSAFTDAYHKHDITWMKKVKTTLERIWLCEALAMVFMVIIAPWFYRIWIGNSVSVGTMLTIGMALFLLMQSIGAVYMNLINGIGTIRIQLIVYVFFALISWPLMQLSCRLFGLAGIVLAPTLVYSVQAILGKIQLEKILNGTSSGVWNK